jgi:hypothetical protein
MAVCPSDEQGNSLALALDFPSGHTLGQGATPDLGAAFIHHDAPPTGAPLKQCGALALARSRFEVLELEGTAVVKPPRVLLNARLRIGQSGFSNREYAPLHGENMPPDRISDTTGCRISGWFERVF